MSSRRLPLLTIIGPGILVAATGVGAGDLATGAFTGSKLGVAVLWAVLVGAGLKFVLTEGLARWQLVTGDTLLEGCVKHFGRGVQLAFLIYLLLWSFFVGSALMSACGVTAHAVCPVFSGREDKILYGLIHSAVAVALVRRGGFRLFEKVMSACVGVMFVIVVVTACLVRPPVAEVASGLFVPAIPRLDADGLQWTVALMGGVGGTLTVLCYGYWIREERRTGTADLRTCRIDLAVGYTVTALFGLAMVVIGGRIEVTGSGSGLIVQLADELQTQLGSLGSPGRWAFLLGGWAAVFSSLLGVWQSVPYLFADFRNLTRNPSGASTGEAVDTESPAYRGYLYGLAIVPAIGLYWDFEQMQKLYAIVGAAFMPLLALALLILNGRSSLVGAQWRNSRLTTVLLIASLAAFLIAGAFEIQKKVLG